MRTLLSLLFFFALTLGFSQGSSCADADPFCSDTAEIFPNTTGGSSAESGPDYGCLGSTPDPAWYYMQVGIAGDINLTISQESAGGFGLDVDFICWGPFDNLDGSCDQLTSGNTVDCSFSTDDVENCDIPNTQVGEFYIVLITNYSGSSGTIDFQQTSGNGQTDCNILLPCFADAGTDDGFCTGGTALLGGIPTASGGSNNFDYSWSPSTGLDASDIANPSATPSVTTTYTVTVDDGQGCIQTDDVTVTVFEDPIADPGADQVLDCLNPQIDLDGSNSITSAYVWSTADGNIVAGNALDIATVDAPGTYLLEVTSIDGCTDSETVEVTLGDTDADATITGPTDLCEGEVGDFSILIDQAGEWDITYMIDGIAQPPLALVGDQLDFTNTADGVYEIFSIDNSLCTVFLDGSVDLHVEPLPTIDFPLDDIYLCPGEVETIFPEITGEGNVTFNFAIDGLPQGSIVTTAGLYSFDVSAEGNYEPISVNTNNCIGVTIGSFDAMEVPFPTADFQEDYTICEGETAMVALELTGSSPFLYEYTIDGVLQPAEASASGSVTLPIQDAGSFELISITDSYCEGTGGSLTEVIVNPLPIATISGGDFYCSNVEVDLDIALVGTAPFTIGYTLNGAPQAAITTSDLSYTIQTMVPGAYEISTITDALCDDGTQNSTTILHYPPISVNLAYNALACEGDSIAVTAVPTGGQSMGYLYEWTDANGTTFSENPLELMVTEDQLLSLSVNDGCDIPSDYVYAAIEVQAYPQPSFIALGDSLCVGEPIEFIRDAIDESVLCYWTFDDGSTQADCDGVIHFFLSDGYQGVELTSVTSAGCSTTNAADSVVYVVPDAIAQFEAVSVEGTIFDPEIQFENSSEYAVTYLWEFGDGEFSTAESPLHYYPAAISDFYPACLSAFNYLGCVDTMCYLVEIEPEFLMSVPNTFTPDNDGVNDLFVPIFNDIVLAEYNLRIFDRLGEVVFESSDQFEKWNGAGTAGSNYYGQDAVYFYHVMTREINRTEKREFFGEINLLR